MLDIKLLRENSDYVKQQLARFEIDGAVVDRVLAFDERRRALLREVEDLKARRNAVSKAISRMQDEAERNAQIAAMREVGERISALDHEVARVEEEQRAAMLEIRNLPHPDVPDGSDDGDNPVVYQEGEPRTPPFVKPHWDLAEALGIINFEQGVKLAGSRFYVMRGLGARLQRATIQWLLDLHLRQGYEEIYTPFVVRENVLWGSGQLPRFRDNLYRDEESGLWLVPTLRCRSPASTPTRSWRCRSCRSTTWPIRPAFARNR